MPGTSELKSNCWFSKSKELTQHAEAWKMMLFSIFMTWKCTLKHKRTLWTTTSLLVSYGIMARRQENWKWARVTSATTGRMWQSRAAILACHLTCNFTRGMGSPWAVSPGPSLSIMSADRLYWECESVIVRKISTSNFDVCLYISHSSTSGMFQYE